MKHSSSKERIRFTISGAVQGVGFRPFVYRLAHELKLSGWIKNTPEGIITELEGMAPALDTFRKKLKNDLPPASFISSREEESVSPCNDKGFKILPSSHDSKASVPILADLALCPDCLNEMNDPGDRRYRYPFITCTNCGPRFTIMTGLPYDRPRTTMKAFSLCAKCTEEYKNPLDRRFHAQPLACPDCGPHLYLTDAAGKILAKHDEALTVTAQAIRNGSIIALKGLGGFHLICDARNPDAVNELRRRKHRPTKPFALMMPDLNTAKSYCEISDQEVALLTSVQSPIVLLDKIKDSSLLTGIAPGNPALGVMLPYTPIHHLLLDELKFPVIATSGNRGGEPICTDETEALERLDGIADLFLVHNRPIAQRSDDSIIKIMAGRPMILRRGRGYAPLPVASKPFVKRKENNQVILAVGSHLKNTISISVNGQIISSPHVGDLDSPQAINGHREAISTLCNLYDTAPSLIVHDAHPDYYSTLVAKKAPEDVQKIPVQHHYAHALSCMADNNISPPCTAIVWDGTGYGEDGTVWGGEFLKITESGYKRIGHLHPFRLPGGDAAALQPWRVALALLHEAGLKPNCIKGVTDEQIRLVWQMLDKDINCPVTTSAGRLFDGVSALLGLCSINTFEGEAAMSLEFAATSEHDETYPYKINNGTIDWRPMIATLIGDDLQISATKFHNTLALAATDMAKSCSEKNIILTGGCFQNRVLLEKLINNLANAGMEPLWHRNIPPNDGGISAGQIVAAATRTGRKKMCLAIPGKIISVKGEGMNRSGKIQYGATVKEASLAFVPLAKEDDYVLVHAGVAINIVDEAQAMTTLDYLDEIGEIEEQTG